MGVSERPGRLHTAAIRPKGAVVGRSEAAISATLAIKATTVGALLLVSVMAVVWGRRRAEVGRFQVSSN